MQEIKPTKIKAQYVGLWWKAINGSNKLTPQQMVVLASLWKGERMKLGEITTTSGVRYSSVRTILTMLKKMGFVTNPLDSVWLITQDGLDEIEENFPQTYEANVS